MDKVKSLALQSGLQQTSKADRWDQFNALREANSARDQVWDPEGKITALFRATEFGEEGCEVVEVVGQLAAAAQLMAKIGKVLGVVKKLEREEMGLKGSRKTIEDLRAELGDAQITLDLLAMRYNIDLWEATKASFNKKSNEHELGVYL